MTDILTEYLESRSFKYTERLQVIPDLVVPIVVAHEIIGGRLKKVRECEPGKGGISLEHAYLLFQKTLVAFTSMNVVAYTAAAAEVYEDLRKKKLGKSHDLQIAAICIANSATLVTRNRRDFEKIPGLIVDCWN